MNLRNRLHVFLNRIFQPFRSVRFRLTVWAVILLGVVLTAFSTFVYTTSAQNLRDNSVSQLSVRMRSISRFYQLALLNYYENGEMHLPTVIAQGGVILQDNETVALMNPKGQTIQKLGLITDQEINTLTQSFLNDNVGRRLSSAIYQMNIAPPSGNIKQTYLFVFTPIDVPGDDTGPGLLLYGLPLDPTGQLNRLLFTLIIASSAIILLALAGGYWLAGRVMHPVQIITRAAREISETDLRKRLNLRTKDELGELANTFDAMLDRLQAAFDRQRQFTADASHELRTPLTIVSLEAARALEHRRSTDDYVQALKVIKSENEYMTSLVNDLLTLARMDAGQSSLKTEELDLSDVALDVVERLAPIANKQGVTLATGDLPEISIIGDRQFLGQMLTNLVENAIKYSVGDDKKVFVETGTAQNGKGPIGWVKVEDNGPGIPEEHIPHLFDRFYRVDEVRSQTGGANDTEDDGIGPTGSGLGLSIVLWVAKAHGGEVSVTSEPGKGSTFVVNLPIK